MQAAAGTVVDDADIIEGLTLPGAVAITFELTASVAASPGEARLGRLRRFG